MYYIDTNILIYSNDIESPFHQSASEIFNNILSREEAIITDSRKLAFPWSAAQAKNYIKILLDAVQELHFLNIEIITEAFRSVNHFDIRRYGIFDHLIAHSMKFYGVSRLITLNRKDFEKYGFIKEIISPERS